MYDYKWTVCYWTNNDECPQKFERFDTKEELMDFIAEEQEENARVLNDYMVFPPHTEIALKDIPMHGVPDIFK